MTTLNGRVTTEQNVNGTMKMTDYHGPNIPEPTDADGGKVLSVENAEYKLKEPERELPTITEADNGKVLQAVNGNWIATPVADSTIATFVDDYINSALEGDY